MNYIKKNKKIPRVCLICESIHWCKNDYYGTLTKCGCGGNTGPAFKQDILKHGNKEDLTKWNGGKEEQ